MKKLFTVVYGSFITFALVAAPTANEDFVIEEAANAYTNALRDAKDYADGQIQAIPAPDFSTSNATLVATIEETAPAPGNYAVVSNAAMGAIQREQFPAIEGFSLDNCWTNITIISQDEYFSVGPVLRGRHGDPTYKKFAGWGVNVSQKFWDDLDESMSEWIETVDAGVVSVNSQTGAVVLMAADVGAVPTTRKINGQPLTNDITIASGVTSVNAKTGTVTLAASDVGAYSSTAGNTLAGQVATIGAHLNAEDARFVVTNYDSAVTRPSASLQISQDGDWMEIWNELTRWGDFYDRWVPSNIYTRTQVDTALAGKADCAWGFYDSHTGGYAPDGYTWVSSPKIAIAGGLAYQRTVTAEGAVWVLESNGLVTEVGGVVSNGFFRVSDDEGNALFEIVKGNKRTVGAQADSVQVIGAFTPTKLQIVYAVTAEEHPTIEVSASLDNPAWYAETEASCPANVSWSGVSGNYVATVQAKSSSATQLFVKAEYLVGGETYIRNNGPVSVDGGILCTDGIHKVRPVYNNGNVTWEVVQ